MSEENKLAVDLLLNLWNVEIFRLNGSFSQSLLEPQIKLEQSKSAKCHDSGT